MPQLNELVKCACNQGAVFDKLDELRVTSTAIEKT